MEDLEGEFQYGRIDNSTCECTKPWRESQAGFSWKWLSDVLVNG